MFFIERAGEICGLTTELSRNERNPKKIIELAMTKLVLFKMSLMGDEMEAVSAFDVDDDAAHQQSFTRGDEEEAVFSDIDEFDDL